MFVVWWVVLGDGACEAPINDIDANYCIDMPANIRDCVSVTCVWWGGVVVGCVVFAIVFGGGCVVNGDVL